MKHPLDKELETYRVKLSSLLVNEGTFVLIHGAEVEDTFDTYGDAMKAGYRLFGLAPFLVKQIERYDVKFFSRNIKFTRIDP
jgi:hypothetical protein